MAPRNAERLVLGNEDGRLVAGLFLAELRPQACYLYTRGRSRALLAAAHAYDWHSRATPHLAFRNARPAQRLYLDAEVEAAEYGRRWGEEDHPLIGLFSATEVRQELWPWPKRRGYAASVRHWHDPPESVRPV